MCCFSTLKNVNYKKSNSNMAIDRLNLKMSSVVLEVCIFALRWVWIPSMPQKGLVWLEHTQKNPKCRAFWYVTHWAQSFYRQPGWCNSSLPPKKGVLLFPPLLVATQSCVSHVLGYLLLNQFSLIIQGKKILRYILPILLGNWIRW